MGTISASILPEWDDEWASTRRVLACVPETKLAFRPHPKSWTLGELATHLANIPTWTLGTMNATELDLAPPGGPAWTPPKVESAAGTLATLDRNVHAAREALAKASDADFLVPWTLKKGGQVLFTLPRIACVRSFVLSHMIHHRGQLTVYLRLCDVALPSIYGPTADAAL